MSAEFIIDCPHCKISIAIQKEHINCGIFRHGHYKNTYKQVEQHSKKEYCDYLINNNLVYGCCKPIKLVYDKNEYKLVVCDYV